MEEPALGGVSGHGALSIKLAACAWSDGPWCLVVDKNEIKKPGGRFFKNIM
jgi:hypothetical protein